jgi:NAD(P)-dependent dehydrogenase (short-subunit alcohol dehydrogenase family)
LSPRPLTTAVVTGAGSGLGRALTLDLTRRGAKVLASDISAGALEETISLVRAAGGDARPFITNVRDPVAVKALFDQAVARLGHIDLWANNAGVAVGGPVGGVPLDDWKYCIDVNLYGVIHGCHVVAPYFRERGAGMVLNVASAAGLVSMPNLGPYNVTKAAVVSLSETLYNELRPFDVGVTVLCPTFFPTNIARDGRVHDPRGKRLAEKLMERSKWTPADVAKFAIDDAVRGTLYSVPMNDGRMMWALKRLMPGPFHNIMGWGSNQMAARTKPT